MSKIILGFTGQLAAGKTTAANYLKNSHLARVFTFSAPLRDILDRIYVENSRANLQNLSTDLRERFGQDVLSATIARDVANAEAEIVVVEGVRRLSDIRHLKELPGFHLVNVTADQKVRWERLTQRGQNVDDGQKTFEQFQQDEKAEAEAQIDEVASTADFTLDNNGNINDLEKQLEEIIKKLKVKNKK